MLNDEVVAGVTWGQVLVLLGWVFGALLVTMVIIRPEGLLPAPPNALQEKARQLAGKDANPQEDGS